MNKKQVNELAVKALQAGNPYITKAVKFYIDQVEHYIYFDKVMTKEEIDNAYLETASHDIQMGYKDRMVGYYDKWYRYSHSDEGRAYDLGVRFATTNNKCSEEMIIIGNIF